MRRDVKFEDLLQEAKRALQVARRKDAYLLKITDLTDRIAMLKRTKRKIEKRLDPYEIILDRGSDACGDLLEKIEMLEKIRAEKRACNYE